MLIWGFSLSAGLFQDYYSTGPFSDASTASVAAIGTTALALEYSEFFFLIFLYRRLCVRVSTFADLDRPHWIRPLTWVAVVGAGLSLFASSFCTRVWQLILLQGVVYGLFAGIVCKSLLCRARR